MGGGVYTALLAEAYKDDKVLALTRKPLVVADIISMFETYEEQNIAAGVFQKDAFQNGIRYETRADIEKALNEMTAVIKRARIDKQMEENANDDEKIRMLFEEKRNIGNIKIRLGEGSF
jgi:hypothetical protein